MSSYASPGTLRPPTTLADLLPLERLTPGIRDVTLVVGGALLTALSAQLAFIVPWTPVPYTFQTASVLLVGTALGLGRGTLAILLYVLIGATGGYLIGFVVAAALCGFLAQKGWDRRFGSAAGLMLLGTLVVYAFGLPVLVAVTGLPVADALEVGVLVFLPWDLAKVLLAAFILPYAWRVAGERAGDRD